MHSAVDVVPRAGVVGVSRNETFISHMQVRLSMPAPWGARVLFTRCRMSSVGIGPVSPPHW